MLKHNSYRLGFFLQFSFLRKVWDISESLNLKSNLNLKLFLKNPTRTSTLACLALIKNISRIMNMIKIPLHGFVLKIFYFQLGIYIHVNLFIETHRFI